MKIYSPIVVIANADEPENNNAVIVGNFASEEEANKALATYKEGQLAGEFGCDSWDECEKRLRCISMSVSFEMMVAELGSDVNYKINTYNC